MTTVNELKDQLRRLVSGRPVCTKYGVFNDPYSCDISPDGWDRPKVGSYNDLEHARDQLMKDIEILERLAPEPVAEAQGQCGQAEFNFYKSGSVWMVGEAGKDPIPFTHSVGLADIHFLLRNEGRQYKPDTLFINHAENEQTVSRAKRDGNHTSAVEKGVRAAIEKIRSTPGLECLTECLSMERLRAKGMYKYSPDPKKPVTWNLNAPS